MVLKLVFATLISASCSRHFLVIENVGRTALIGLMPALLAAGSPASDAREIARMEYSEGTGGTSRCRKRRQSIILVRS
jgi:hypothetical protein